MKEVIVKYKNTRSLKALRALAKSLDMVFGFAPRNKHKKIIDLPIRFAKKPDPNALSGIWKDNLVTQEELRKKAWGIRL